MTDKQPEALRLADELMGAAYSMPADKRGWFDDKDEGTVPHNVCTDAAAELRRLYEVNAELVEALRDITAWYSARDSENEILPAINQNPEIYRAMQALAKAQGENNDAT